MVFFRSYCGSQFFEPTKTLVVGFSGSDFTIQLIAAIENELFLVSVFRFSPSSLVVGSIGFRIKDSTVGLLQTVFWFSISVVLDTTQTFLDVWIFVGFCLTIIAFYSISRVLVFVRFRIGPSWFCDHHRFLQHRSGYWFFVFCRIWINWFLTIIAFYSISRILVFFVFCRIWIFYCFF